MVSHAGSVQHRARRIPDCLTARLLCSALAEFALCTDADLSHGRECLCDFGHGDELMAVCGEQAGASGCWRLRDGHRLVCGSQAAVVASGRLRVCVSVPVWVVGSDQELSGAFVIMNFYTGALHAVNWAANVICPILGAYFLCVA